MQALVWLIGFFIIVAFSWFVVRLDAFLKRKLRLAVVACALLALMSTGCSASATAQDFANVLSGIINIAKAEIPALPAADASIVTQWTTLGTTLDAQLQSCITVATAAGGKKTAFLACFNTFAAGIASPSELAQLRVLSAGSQGKAQLWVTAIILGVNAAFTSFGGAPAATPQVAAVQPTHAELAELARRVGVSRTYGF